MAALRETCRSGRLGFGINGVFRLMILSLTLLLVACANSQLNTTQSTAFNIKVVTALDSTIRHPANVSFPVQASCGTGEQLIGGGYLLTNNTSNPINVVIEASYPKNDMSTWLVQARNPDNTAIYTADRDVQILVAAYCVTTPNFDLGIKIASYEGPTLFATSSSPATTDAPCSLVGGGVPLSGGFFASSFASEPPTTVPGSTGFVSNWPGLEGSGIITAGPSTMDAGWSVRQDYTPAAVTSSQPWPMNVTVFAVCATKGITTQGTIRTGSSVLGRLPAVAACAKGEFSVGGGYDVGSRFSANASANGTPAITGNLSDTDTSLLSGWRVDSESNVGGNVTASALCFPIPIL